MLAREAGPLGVRVTIVEPGGIRTDWAGSSMHVDDVQDDYQPTVGAFMQGIRKRTDAARGDPAKMAQAVLHLASLPEPPLRVLLGSDAAYLAGLVAEQRAAEDANWHALSVSTDFDGMGDFRETPVGQMLAKMVRVGG